MKRIYKLIIKVNQYCNKVHHNNSNNNWFNKIKKQKPLIKMKKINICKEFNK